MPTPGRSPRDARGRGPDRLLRERDGGSRKPAGQVLHLKNRILIGRATYEGGGGQDSTAISFRPRGHPRPRFTVGGTEAPR